VASLNPKRGFATLWATVTSLILAGTVAAIISYGTIANRAARADLERVQAEALLDGGHLMAALGVLENVAEGRLAWTETESGATFSILAEPETQKVGLDAQPDGGIALAALLGASDPLAAQTYLRSAYAAGDLPSIRAADPSARWKSCAPSVLSYWGLADTAALQPAVPPNRRGQRPRVGEVWRIVVAIDGWRDERFVRLTDNPRDPAQLIKRNFGRLPAAEEEPCASLYAT
jgi:hypothetical protein